MISDAIEQKQSPAAAASRGARVVWPILAALAGLVAAVPLLGQLPATHDGLHHIFRLFELDRALRAWQLYPRVFTDMGFGYGFPVLNYYSPLSYYLAWLGTAAGLGYVGGLQAAYVVGLIAASLAMYAWASAFLPAPGALLAAVAHTFMPYHVADVAVRGALAESTAFLWPPLLLWLIGRYARGRRPADLALVALSVAGFLLTHNLTAFMFSPVLALYVVLLLGLPRRAVLGTYAALGIAAIVGASLSAFYWLPAVLEVKYVLAGTVEGLGDLLSLLQPLDQWLSRVIVHRYTPAQGVAAQHPLSIVQAIVAVLGLLGASYGWRRASREGRAAFATAAVGLVGCLFLSTPAAAGLWQNLPPLHFLQFPWRLQAVVGLATATLSGAVLLLPLPRPARWPSVAILSVAMAATSLAGLRLEPAHLPTATVPITDDQISLDGVLDYDFQTALWLRDYGGDWLLEYLPIWALGERETFFLASPVPEGMPSLPAGSTVRVVEDSPRRTLLAVSLPQPATIVLHRFYVPGWQAETATGTIAGRPVGSLGLLAFDLPAGEHTLAVTMGPTPARTAGLVLTVVALALLLAYCAIRRAPAPVALLGCAAALLLALVAVRAQGHSTVLRPRYAEATVGDSIQVVGYASERRAGTLDVWVYWLATAEPPTDYRAFVHAASAAGDTMAQHDGQPGNEFSPTSRWLPGEVVPDRHSLALTDGPVALYAGMYTWPEVTNLPVTQGGAPSPDGRVLLGEAGR
ncbi:MAG: 6-pyruvoyl-tetrahydropterin synthase-related protein [Anaerolineae bacterium]